MQTLHSSAIANAETNPTPNKAIIELEVRSRLGISLENKLILNDTIQADLYYHFQSKPLMHYR